MKTARIDLRVSPNQKQAFEQQAKVLNMSLSDYIISVLDKKDYIHCPQCDMPVFERFSLPIVGEANILCRCGHIFVFDFGII